MVARVGHDLVPRAAEILRETVLLLQKIHHHSVDMMPTFIDRTNTHEGAFLIKSKRNNLFFLRADYTVALCFRA